MGIPGLSGNNTNANNNFNIKPDINHKKIKANILNIYIMGNYQQIKNFEKHENLNIMNKEFKSEFLNLDLIDQKYNWIFCEEMYSEKLMNEIICNIIVKFKKKETFNAILILSEFYENNKRFEEIYKSILKCLDQTNKIYRPIVILANKKQNIEQKVIINENNGNDKNDNANDIHNMDIEEQNKNNQNIIPSINYNNKKENIPENKHNNNKKEEKYNNNLVNNEDKSQFQVGNQGNLFNQIKDNENLKLENDIQNYKGIQYNKFLEIVYYKDDNFSEIMNKLNSLFCYYNNIGDIYSIINEMMKQTEINNFNDKIIQYKATLNILVMGRPGGGKSTLINLLLNQRKAREGIGSSITKLFSKYIHNQYPITFVDTPGFENDADLFKMMKFLDDSTNFFGDGKYKFHLILYVINASNERFFIGEEKKLIAHISELRIPIFFVLTKARNEDYAFDYKENIKVNLIQTFPKNKEFINHIYCCHLMNEIDGKFKRFGVDELLNNIRQYFQEELNNLANIKNNLENKQFQDIHSFFKHQILMNTLSYYDNFKIYLIKLSDNIISNYKNIIILEEQKRKNNEYYLPISSEKINDLLVKHLAYELDVDPSDLNINELKENNLVITNDRVQVGCYNTPNNRMKESNKVSNSKKTQDLGEYAKKVFIAKLEQKYKNGINEYLQIIIDNYQTAIDSLIKMNITK
jgi:small GTP-binding protein